MMILIKDLLYRVARIEEKLFPEDRKNKSEQCIQFLNDCFEERNEWNLNELKQKIKPLGIRFKLLGEVRREYFPDIVHEQSGRVHYWRKEK